MSYNGIDGELTTNRPEATSEPQEQTPVEPRLPPEILLQVLLSPSLSPVLSPTPLTNTTLHCLLSVSRLCNACAQRQLHSVLILPRHVRDFHRYYDRQRLLGFPGALDYSTRAIFSSLDDVSRLTFNSAGWEAKFLRLLHILGPGVRHLSLWHSESRVLLKDAGQVRKFNPIAGQEQKPFGHSGTTMTKAPATSQKANREGGGGGGALGSIGPSWSWGQGDTEDVDFQDSMDEESEIDDEDEVATSDKASGSQPVDTRAELAATRERARQQMPMWLRRELETKPTAEVLRIHRAHLSLYGDESLFESFGDPTNHAAASKRADNRPRDRRRLKGCRPEYLSLVLSLPLFENQSPDRFSSLLVFSRVKELDAYFPVPAHAPKLAGLVAHLRGRGLKRLKIGTLHASLVLALPPFSTVQAGTMERRQKQKEQAARYALAVGAEEGSNNSQNAASASAGPSSVRINLTRALSAILQDPDLSDALNWEFTGKHTQEPWVLERAFTEAAVRSGRGGAGGGSMSSSSRDAATAAGAERPGPAVDSTPRPSPVVDQDGIELIRVKVIQRNQTFHGRLRERKDDFVERCMGMGHGVWSRWGVWDEADD